MVVEDIQDWLDNMTCGMYWVQRELVEVVGKISSIILLVLIGVVALTSVLVWRAECSEFAIENLREIEPAADAIHSLEFKIVCEESSR